MHTLIQTYMNIYLPNIVTRKILLVRDTQRKYAGTSRLYTRIDYLGPPLIPSGHMYIHTNYTNTNLVLNNSTNDTSAKNQKP